MDKRFSSTNMKPLSSLESLLCSSQSSLSAPVDIKFKSLSMISPLSKVRFFSDIEITFPEYSFILKSFAISLNFFFVFEFKFFSFKFSFPIIDI